MKMTLVPLSRGALVMPSFCRSEILDHRYLQACGFSCCSPLFVSIRGWLFWGQLFCFCFVSYLTLLCLCSKGVWDTTWSHCTGLIRVLSCSWRAPHPSSSQCHPYGHVVLHMALMLGLGDHRRLLLLTAPTGFPALSLRDLCLGKEVSVAKAISVPCKGGPGGEGTMGDKQWASSPGCSAPLNFPQKNKFLTARNTDVEMLKEQEISCLHCVTFLYFLWNCKKLSKIPN